MDGASSSETKGRAAIELKMQFAIFVNHVKEEDLYNVAKRADAGNPFYEATVLCQRRHREPAHHKGHMWESMRASAISIVSLSCCPLPAGTATTHSATHRQLNHKWQQMQRSKELPTPPLQMRCSCCEKGVCSRSDVGVKGTHRRMKRLRRREAGCFANSRFRTPIISIMRLSCREVLEENSDNVEQGCLQIQFSRAAMWH